MDATSSKPIDSLPSINQLNFDKVKSESPNFSRHSQNPLDPPNAPLPSPTSFPYPGPPPPYSYPSSNPSSAVSLASPAESQRTSHDEKDQAPHRTSLPSIQEVIHGDSKFALVSQPPASSAPAAPPLQRAHTASTPFSAPPIDAVSNPPPLTYNESQLQQQRQHPTISIPPPPSHPQPQPSSTYSSLHSPIHASHYAQRSPDYLTRPPPRHDDYASGRHGRPPVREPHQLSPTHKREPSSGGSSHPPYSYAPPPSSQYSFSAPYKHPSAPSQHAPVRHPAFDGYPMPQRYEGPDLNRVDETRKAGLKGHHGEIYGYSVRRHLDHFDLDSSLREVIQSSQYLLNGVENHLERFKSSQASGQVPVPVPSGEACDDLIRTSQTVTKTLSYMKEMLANSQDHHAVPEQPSSQNFKGPVDYDDEGSMYEDPKVGNGMAPDNKKRRARAAPPGRCHSCNRAETPEWRRGPDGARTLCNACGLHYAKLTRKTKNQASIRTKSMDSSPI